MLGYELHINNKIVSASLEKGVVSIIATCHYDALICSIDLSFGGLNTSKKENDEMIDWYKTSLNEGDEFTIKVKDILDNSTPFKLEEVKRKTINECQLESYKALKKELEEKGLIKKTITFCNI